MIHRVQRDKVAELLRHFAAGLLTTDDYEDRFRKIGDIVHGRDKALEAVVTRALHFSDDFQTHKMTGNDKLVGEDREEFARVCLFLYSDYEYSRPKRSDTTDGLRDAIACLLHKVQQTTYARLTSSAVEQYKMTVAFDEAVWPFLRPEYLAEARRHPRLLRGTA